MIKSMGRRFLPQKGKKDMGPEALPVFAILIAAFYGSTVIDNVMMIIRRRRAHYNG
jgi:hypothetical protein